jgi:asparagine synthase (glutamine-hydrolysing)
VAVIGTPPPSAPAIDRDGDSWAAAAGTPHAAERLTGTAPVEIDGQFALVAYDARSEKVTVAADALGLQALHAADRNGLTYVSTSSLALARHLRSAPDRFGFASFLRAGYLFGAQTLWEGVERLEPATELGFGPSEVERTTYWRPEIDRDVSRLGFDAAVDHCLEIALETYGRRLARRRDAWVDLTGGYDTRLLALLLTHAGVTFDANTRGDPVGADRRIARQLAGTMGWRLEEIVVPDDWDRTVADVLPTAAAWADGTLEVLELSWVLWAHARLAREHPLLLIGGGGEHLRGFAWRQEFLQGGKSTRVNWDNWLDMRMLHPMDVSLFETDPTADVRADMRGRMGAWVAPYADELNTTQLDVLYAYKMTGHFGAYRSADAAHLHAELPFYFRPVFTAAFSTSHRHRDNHRLMRHLISRLDRKAAAIATSTGGPAEPWRPTNLHRFFPYYTQIGRKAANKLSQRTLGRALLPGRTEAWWCPPAARRAAVAALTHDQLRSRPLYDEPALERLLERAGEPAFEETTVLGRVLTAELALRAAGASF